MLPSFTLSWVSTLPSFRLDLVSYLMRAEALLPHMKHSRGKQISLVFSLGAEGSVN